MSSPLNLTSLGTGNGISSVDGSLKNYAVVENRAVKSLFSGGVGQFSPYPASIDKATGDVTGMNNAAFVHNDYSNDISTTSIIDYCKNYPGMKLDYADFAYLKHIGVYPNNRLIIARRFQSGVGNDLTALDSSPMATLVSWVDVASEDADFLSIKYNEVFEDAEANFERLLNDIGTDLKGSPDQKGMETLGTNTVGAAFNILPFPGFMEGVLAQVMKEMGLSTHGIGNSPYGNPNIIAQARIRKTQDFKQGGSGLVGKFNVKMTIEYEQKFINGVDPTLVYFDILQNALTFGTSDAAFRFNSAFAEGTNNIIRDLSSGNVEAVFKAVVSFVKSLMNAILNIITKIADAFINPKEEALDNNMIYNAFATAIRVTFGHVISKYKIRIVGIANALSGSPSTPWHITIGNPKKPIFSSGDMECVDVTVTLGKVLAFNDLPSTIKIEVNFISARNLGAQEIFNRFNTGKGRSYARSKLSFNEQPEPKFPTQSVSTVQVDLNKGTSGSETTSASASPAPEKKDLLSVGSPVFEDRVDKYLLPKDASGQGWLNYSGPVISGRVDNTSPEFPNGGNSNLSGQSNTSNTTGNNLTGVNVPTTGSASPPGTTGLGPIGASPSVPPGASPSVPPPLTEEQKKAELEKLNAELTQVTTQLSTTPPEIEVSVELKLGGAKIAVLPWNNGNYKELDQYRQFRGLSSQLTETPIFGPNPKYDELNKKKNELETKIKNLN